ncbi:hypothetical protein CAPTEDRAFT_220372 [Capitella teleta]|uniref:EF-hand domain-containing protein n=1 Tax=Capitella teleta TaxID=283909 RepID=R7ULU5_CAPTE|nr:hypothetical protein CAPTEDRAFT_220372 [Capitella teleta]|eukprot:ELU07185.1 hypothetical protein CAPTEDRAFT_220372 [Capitella teleta]
MASYKSYLEFKPTVPEMSMDEEFKKHSGGDDKMDASELSRALSALFQKEGTQSQFGVEACRSMLAMMDRDKSGYLNVSEFKQMMKEIDVWKKAFVAFDSDRSGFIDSYELSKVFKTIGFELSRQVLLSIVTRYGGKARRMGLEDFIHCCCRIVVMYGEFSKYKMKDKPDVAQLGLEEWMSITMHY